MYIAPKELRWLGSSRAELKAFPADARRVAGFQLLRVQLGLDPNDWKSVPSVGPGVREIRIHTDLEHRVMYVATLPDAVYVLHAFGKKRAKIAKRHITTARSRLQALLKQRRGHAR